jgi:amino acid adenylation domain-containing protein
MPARVDEHVRAKCFHPSGHFVEFSKEDVEISISERFEKIVRLYPERIAVKTRTQTLTYNELNAQANRLAHELLARRHSLPEPVGLYVDEWSALVVAHLAVLKVGKFSVALDPMAEASRLAHIASDSGLRVMIGDANTTIAAAELVSDECVSINLNALRSDLSDSNPGCRIPPEANAYLRYTSGSTGSAKGAIKTHRHALRDTMDFVNAFHICPEDRVTLIGFGTIGKYPLKALLTGACFCPLDARKEGLVHLADWLRSARTTTFYSFPAALRYFLNDLADSEILADLRLIELSGEAVYRGDVELIKGHVSPDCILVNTLSSAETGTVSMYFVDAKTPVNSERVPVGYPTEGVDILILDENGNSLGFDQVGEFAARSRSLSAGYWRKPDVTRQKFIRQPDGGATSIYRTGDLGRLSPDGCLHLLGRKDFQVKIRSFRVDVTEVETALIEHRDIRSVAVAGKDDPSGNTTLVAYVVPRRNSEPTPKTLRAFLKGKLPDYMIPAQFVFLDVLPMMSTGKINRRALPTPGSREIKRRSPIIVPRTPLERTLAEIWAEVLSIKEVGVRDNFFDLGGHSLAATRVVSRVIKQFQIDIPLQSLFQSPTISDMAAVVAEHQGKRLSEKQLTTILDELESLSDEEAVRLLSKDG